MFTYSSFKTDKFFYTFGFSHPFICNGIDIFDLRIGTYAKINGGVRYAGHPPRGRE